MEDHSINLPVTLQSAADTASRPNLGPEIPYYPDNGCKHSPSCLSCPLPVCIHDLGKERVLSARAAVSRRSRAEKTARGVREFIDQGMPKKQAVLAQAAREGIHEGSVYRRLRQYGPELPLTNRPG